jgi:hypothetical protein
MVAQQSTALMHANHCGGLTPSLLTWTRARAQCAVGGGLGTDEHVFARGRDRLACRARRVTIGTPSGTLIFCVPLCIAVSVRHCRSIARRVHVGVGHRRPGSRSHAIWPSGVVGARVVHLQRHRLLSAPAWWLRQRNRRASVGEANGLGHGDRDIVG